MPSIIAMPAIESFRCCLQREGVMIVFVMARQI